MILTFKNIKIVLNENKILELNENLRKIVKIQNNILSVNFIIPI